VTETFTATRAITYTYDPLNRLTATDYSTGESYAYQYDAIGNPLPLRFGDVPPHPRWRLHLHVSPVTWTSQRRRALVPGVAEGDGARGELIIVLFYPL
jgi:YD repeat-containing protein